MGVERADKNPDDKRAPQVRVTGEHRSIEVCPECGESLVVSKHAKGWIILHLKTGNREC